MVMVITTEEEYVKFFQDLKMGSDVTLYSFLSNEKRVMKAKLENKNSDKEKIQAGIEILDKLIYEINKFGEKEVIEKHGR